MKMSKKRTRKIDRKRFVDKYSNSAEQRKKDALLFEKLVLNKNEYLDNINKFKNIDAFKIFREIINKLI